MQYLITETKLLGFNLIFSYYESNVTYIKIGYKAISAGASTSCYYEGATN